MSTSTGALGNKDKNLDGDLDEPSKPDWPGLLGNNLEELGQEHDDGLAMGEFEKLGAAEAKAANVGPFLENGANDFSELATLLLPFPEDAAEVKVLVSLVGDFELKFGGPASSRVTTGGPFKSITGGGGTHGGGTRGGDDKRGGDDGTDRGDGDNGNEGGTGDFTVGELPVEVPAFDSLLLDDNLGQTFDINDPISRKTTFGIMFFRISLSGRDNSFLFLGSGSCTNSSGS